MKFDERGNVIWALHLGGVSDAMNYSVHQWRSADGRSIRIEIYYKDGTYEIFKFDDVYCTQNYYAGDGTLTHAHILEYEWSTSSWNY